MNFIVCKLHFSKINKEKNPNKYTFLGMVRIYITGKKNI